METQAHSPNALPRILIVDDHPNTASMLARALEKANFRHSVEVLTACSGDEALTVGKKGPIDVLITDFMMPGMSGLNLIEALKTNGKQPGYTILVTAYDTPGLDEVAKRLKVDRYLVKPVRPETIQAIVAQHIDGQYPTQQNTDPEPPTPFKILIADDYPDNLRLLSVRLRAEGYTFITAADGVETLDKLRDEMPDLLLLDINMPRKDGLEVLQEMRADPEIAHIPVIVVSAARVGSHDVLAGLNLGADDYIVKPFDWNEMAARVRTKLRVKKVEDSLRRRNRELSLLPEIGQDLSARMDVDELASILLERVVAKLGASNGHLYIFQPDGNVFHKTHHKIDLTQWSEESALGWIVTEGIEARVVSEHRALLVRDTQAEEHWLKTPLEGARSALAVPFLGRHKVLGVLTIAHDQPNYFNQDQLNLVQAIASQAAIAIENAQLYSTIQQEQKRLEAVLHAVGDAIMLMDPYGRLQLVNPAGSRLFTDVNTRLGYPLPRGKGYDALVDLLTESHEVDDSTLGEVPWPDGRTFSVMITPVENGGHVSVLHDVSHFKELERVKDEFIATASHDLKNPITSVMGFSELLSRVGPLNEQQNEFLQRIRQAAGQMNDLVLGLLELARLDAGIPINREPLSLADLLTSVTQEFQLKATEKAQKLELLPLEQGLLLGDPLRLRQVLRNLIGNALKYTPYEGQITVGAEVQERFAQIFVQDTGLGIPAKDVPHIFDRFYRVHDDDRVDIEGNGLGLAIVKAIVEQHGGKITVESEHGKGTCFAFTVPLTHSLNLPSE
ncbi:MAG: response regulator [Anaerolineales bacterium]|nr:response regulator [Anaerolineales bacterium]